VEITENLKFD